MGEVKRKIEDLGKYGEKAREVLEGYGLNPPTDIPLKLEYLNFYDRSETIKHGYCKVKGNKGERKPIKVVIDKTFYLYPNTDDHELLEVLIHEYLHSCFPEDCHGGNWKKWSNKISKDGEYTITRVDNHSLKEIEDFEEFNNKLKKWEEVEVYKYIQY